MNDLITRLERAEGPDRELDWAIHIRDGLLGVGMYGDHPRYTASIDAALTLVPEGWKWAVTSRNSACCHEQHVAPLNWAYAPTPALALCIAALRAQQKDTNA